MAVLEPALSSFAADPPANRHTQRLVERYIALTMFVAFFYNAYRYPFKINDPGTSPTYSATPMVLVLGKYVLVALVMLWLLSARAVVRQSVRVGSLPALLALGFMVVVPILAAGFTGQVDLVEVGFIVLPGFLLLFFPEVRLPAAFVNRVLRNVIYAALVVEAIQVALFLTIGRLPALGYPNSFSVRFGSFLDDPNTMGLLISWFFPFDVSYFRGVTRVAVLSGLLLCLILTQSLTGLVVFIVVVSGFVAVHAVRKADSLVLTLVGGIVAIAGARGIFLAYEPQIRAAYRAYMLTKEGSLEQHADAIPRLFSLNLLNLLGLEPKPLGFFSETGYVNILGQLGVPYLVVFLGIGAWATWRAVAMLRDPSAGCETRAFANGLLGLMGAMYVGSLALPAPGMFPLNLLTSLMMTMAIVLRCSPPEELPAAAAIPDRALVAAAR